MFSVLLNFTVKINFGLIHDLTEYLIFFTYVIDAIANIFVTKPVYNKIADLLQCNI